MHSNVSLRKKCPYSESLWSAFFPHFPAFGLNTEKNFEEELIKRAAIRTKGGLGPSRVDADDWPRIILSSCFGTATSHIHKAIAELVKKLCITNISNNNNSASL